MGGPWVTRGLPMGCLWGVHHMPMGYPWNAHRMLMGSSYKSMGYPWTTYKLCTHEMLMRYTWGIPTCYSSANRAMPMGCQWHPTGNRWIIPIH